MKNRTASRQIQNTMPPEMEDILDADLVGEDIGNMFQDIPEPEMDMGWKQAETSQIPATPVLVSTSHKELSLVLDAVYSQIRDMIDTMVMRIVMIFAVIHCMHSSTSAAVISEVSNPSIFHTSNPIPMINETDIQQALQSATWTDGRDAHFNIETRTISVSRKLIPMSPIMNRFLSMSWAFRSFPTRFLSSSQDLPSSLITSRQTPCSRMHTFMHY